MPRMIKLPKTIGDFGGWGPDSETDARYIDLDEVVMVWATNCASSPRQRTEHGKYVPAVHMSYRQRDGGTIIYCETFDQAKKLSEKIATLVGIVGGEL